MEDERIDIEDERIDIEDETTRAAVRACLEEALEHLRTRGWTKRRYVDQRGAACIVGAMGLQVVAPRDLQNLSVMGLDKVVDTAMTYLASVIITDQRARHPEEFAEDDVYYLRILDHPESLICYFNDHGDTTWEDVERWLKNAITSL